MQWFVFCRSWINSCFFNTYWLNFWSIFWSVIHVGFLIWFYLMESFLTDEFYSCLTSIDSAIGVFASFFIGLSLLRLLLVFSLAFYNLELTVGFSELARTNFYWHFWGKLDELFCLINGCYLFCFLTESIFWYF